MPLFVVALFFLIVDFCFCLRRDTLLLAVALLVIGLLFLMLGAGRVKKETKNILRFVQEISVFYHRYYPPLRITGILDCLKKEGFEVVEYPFGNYYCHRNIGQKYRCHFFIANNDTPDCPEAESYSGLFIQIVCESGIIRHKSDTLAIYVSELLKKLFFEQDRRQDVIKEENKG